MASIKDKTDGAMINIHKLLMNTPYGRMGMNNHRDVVKKVSLKEFESIQLRYNILDWFNLDDNLIHVKYTKLPDRCKCEQSNINYEEELINILESDIVNNSTPIAAAVTAWARVIMYPFLLKSKYTDTDSIFLSKPLDKCYIGKQLGKFKQEYGGVIKKGLFVSPKLYILDTLNGYINKSKGFSGKLSLYDYLELYQGGFIDVKDNRWKRSLELENVKIIEQDMRLKGNFDKRTKLFSKGKWINRSPIVINDNLSVVSTDLIKEPFKGVVIYNNLRSII